MYKNSTGRNGSRIILRVSFAESGIIKSLAPASDLVCSLIVIINDLKSANRMGCNVIREQYLLPPEGLVKLYPQMQSIITATEIKGATTRERSYVDVTNFYK